MYKGPERRKANFLRDFERRANTPLLIGFMPGMALAELLADVADGYEEIPTLENGGLGEA